MQGWHCALHRNTLEESVSIRPKPTTSNHQPCVRLTSRQDSGGRREAYDWHSGWEYDLKRFWASGFGKKIIYFKNLISVCLGGLVGVVDSGTCE